jgi:hypothetical protein
MKKIIFITLLLSVNILFAQDLTWLLQFQRGSIWEPVPDSQRITVETGEDFNIIIFPASNSFCYVLNRISNRSIDVLNSQAVKGGDTIEIPLPTNNLSDSSTLYVIMSLTRQTRLENLIDQYKKNPDSVDLGGRRIIKKKKETSKLGEPMSKILPMGGPISSIGKSVIKEATSYSDKNIYVRVITIRAAPAPR